MAGFYGVYLAKQLSQRSQGIRTNQMGRGNKELRTLTVERLLAAFSDTCTSFVILPNLIVNCLWNAVFVE